MSGTFICNAEYPVVKTDAGKLRGYLYNDIFHFLGIKYADAERFQQPKPVKPWDGIRDAHDFGYNCPGSDLPRTMPRGEIGCPHRFWPESEHCQYLNIWTDTIDENAKKPVMVWLHGGGYLDGSAIEQVAYDGDNLARYEDVVCVSVNHRLNVLGFLDVSAYGEEYENSGNAGFADLIAALKWIQNNISGFGGDPSNVTIFGQSGGGGKVSALMQIPEAEGLFHKAVVMSGIIPDDNMLTNTTAPAEMIAETILEELGGEGEGIEPLLHAPEVILERAAGRAQKVLAEKGYATGWGPRRNGWYTGSLCLSESTEFSKKIPTIVGTAFAEFSFQNNRQDKAALSQEERDKMGSAAYGEFAEEYLRLFKKAYPNVNTAYAGTLDHFFRPDTMDYVLKKAADSDAPVYNYIFALPNTMNGGTMAGHGADIPFAFRNVEKVPAWQIPEESDRMNALFAKMLSSFAKTGNPNIGELPEWKPCTGEQIRTMIFDKECMLMCDHDRELQAFIEEHQEKLHLDIIRETEEKSTWKY